MPPFFSSLLVRQSGTLPLSLLLCILVGLGNALPSEAARKYYPPGYSGDEPDRPVKQTPAPSPTPDPPRTIIPKPIIKVVQTPAPARDPLTVMIEQRRFFDALVLVDQRLKKTPNQTSLHLLRGQILREEMRFDEADAEYKGVLSKNKSGAIKASAYSGLGSVAYKKALVAKNLGNSEDSRMAAAQAEAFYKQALATSANYADAWIGIAQLRLLQQKTADARTTLKKVTVTTKTPAATALLYHVTSVKIALMESKFPQALSEAVTASKKYPDNPDLLLLMGEASLSMGRSDDAIIHLRKVLSREPDNTEALKLLSAAFDNKKQSGEAETTLQRAVSLNPADMNAVRALLDLYEVKNQNQRGILLLRSLLEDNTTLDPAIRTAYQRELLNRLYLDNQWEEGYEIGTDLMEHLLTGASEKSGTIDREVALFANIAYYHSKGSLDPTEMIRTPLIQKLLAYCQHRLASDPNNLEDRLDLVLLNPTLQPAPPAKGVMYGPDDLTVAIKLFYLQGDWEGRKRLIQHLNRAPLADSPPSLDLKARIRLAEDLVQLGDYAGARMVLDALRGSAQTAPAETNPVELAFQRLSTLEKEAADQWTSLRMLPRTIPASHWEKTAQDALRLGSGNWKLHAFIADCLLGQKKLAPAYFQQVQASRFATSLSDKKAWAKKAQKTAQNFHRTGK